LTRRRWIADEVRGERALLTGEHALHLSRVLRAEVGQEFDISAGNLVRRGTIVAISAERVEFALGEEVPAGLSTRELTLVLAVFKFDRMEWAIEKCTEIGVARIVPLIARRTDSHLASTAVKRQERWVRLARQAAEQSRRAAAPYVSSPIKFKELAEVCAADMNRVVLSESESDTRFRDVLPASAVDTVLAIGPEGGWSDEEFRWFRESGWVSASLGNNILRAETAAIVACALALDTLR